jgi:hypothetical protein
MRELRRRESLVVPQHPAVLVRRGLRVLVPSAAIGNVIWHTQKETEISGSRFQTFKKAGLVQDALHFSKAPRAEVHFFDVL